MDWSFVRPDRSLVLPVAVVAFPLLNLVRNSLPTYREELTATVLTLHAGYTLLALAIAYIGGAIILSVIETSGIQHAYLDVLLHPSNQTLGAFAIMSIATGGYLAMTPVFFEPPQWVDLAVTPVLFLFGLPLLLAFVGTAALANSGIHIVATSPVDLTISSVAFSVTAIWIFVLATGVIALLGGKSVHLGQSPGKQ